MTIRQPDTVTVLITDLADHSRLYARLGEAESKDLIMAHFRLLRQAIEAFGGREIKTEGDRIIAAFPTASGALKAAIQMQQAQARFNRADPARSLSLRVGLNTGEPIPEGEDLFGTPVIVAARLCDAAEGGEILASEVVRLIAGSPAGISFTDMGRRSLKGLDEELRVFSVGWEPDSQDVALGLSPLQGRSREMARLRDLLQEVRAGHGKVVFISGEPGVGKTRLASEVSALAASLACNVLIGHSYDMDGAPPYLPFAEALRDLVRRRGPEEVRTLAGRGLAALARLLPELGVADTTPLDDATDGGPEAQYARHEALTGVFVAIAREAPLVLLLDDVHWADRLSILLVQHMARRIGGEPLFLVVTYRDREIDSGHPLTAVIADLGRQRLYERLPLQGLDQGQSAGLINSLIGSRAAPEVTGAIFEQTQGNPFFIEEIVTHLQEEGLRLADRMTMESGWSLPESVVSIIERRVERLGPETRRMLDAASVLGLAFGFERAVAVSRLDPAALIESLDSALRAGLLREDGDAYRFNHGLIREVLYRSLTISHRQALHLRAAENLEREGRARAGEVAYHFRSAGPLANAVRVADACRAAGDLALEVMAWQEAIVNFEAAVNAAARVPDFDRAVLAQLHLDISRAQHERGHYPQSIDAADRAIDLFKDLQLQESLADALYAKGHSLLLQGEAAQALECLTAAREIVDSGPDSATPDCKRLQSRILEKVGESLVLLRHYPAAEETSREAVALAEDVGDPHLLAQALFSVGLGHFSALRLAEADAEFARCQELSDPQRSLTGIAADTRAALALAGVGKLAAARQRALAAQERLGRIDSPRHRAWTRAPLALISTLECDLAEAEAQAEMCLREGRQTADPLVSSFVTPCLVLGSVLKGAFDAAEELASSLLTEEERAGRPRSVIQGYGHLAIARAYAGKPDECLAMLEKMAERFNPRVPDLVALPMHVCLAEAAVVIGEGRLASLAFDPLRQLFDSGVSFSLRWPALLPRLLGAIAALQGQKAEAEALLREAERLARESGAVLESVLSAVELSKLLLAAGDHDAAKECLARCLGRETALTVPLLRDRIEKLASELEEPLDSSSESHNIGRGV